MFVLNMLFDFSREDGLFLDRESYSDPLLNSKHWLKVASADPQVSFDLEPPSEGFEDLGVAGTLLIRSANPQHAIGVRIAPDPITAIDPDATGELFVAFGRPVIARQPFASPFVTAGQTRSVFHVPLTRRPSGAGGWLVKLGAIGRAPEHENLTHRYEFALGIEVTSRGVTRSFGEDPEFDIGL